jgi:hypothetical protein
LSPGEVEAVKALPVGAPVQADGGLRERLLSSRAGAVAFNLLSSPALYYWMSRLPGTGLGATRFHPLSRITKLEEGAWAQVDCALRSFDAQPTYDRTRWDEAIEEWRSAGIAPLTAEGVPLPRELLRLPLLARDRAVRDTLVARLSHAGLGATAMYEVPLNRLPGIPAEVRAQGPFSNADELADRLFTLPTHGSVTPRAVSLARQIVRALA